MSTWESDLLNGVAQYLAAQGVGTYRSDGSAYLTTETAIVFGELPVAPDRVIALSLYGGPADEVKSNLSHPRLQLMMRGAAENTLDVGDLATQAFAALQGIESMDFGSAHLVQCYRVSSVPQGLDSNRRSERADNYQIDVNTPNTVGRPL